MLTGVDRSCHTQASEYKLLPHLFAQGVLCRVRYLTIEWHLGWLKERQQDWLSGMALRLGLDKMLTDAVRSWLWAAGSGLTGRGVWGEGAAE